MNHQDRHDKIAEIRKRRDGIIHQHNATHASAFADSLKAHAARVVELKAEISRSAALAAAVAEKKERETRELTESRQAAHDKSAKEREAQIAELSKVAEAAAEEPAADPAREALNAAFDPSLVGKPKLIGDGATDDTAAIQAQIDAVADKPKKPKGKKA